MVQIGGVTMQDLSRLKKYFRDCKSGAFKLIDPGVGRRAYFESRNDYKTTLIKLLAATAARLKALGVPVAVLVGEDSKDNKKTA